MRFRLPKAVRDFIRSKETTPEVWREVSVCCGAKRWMETDFCNDCKEHSEFIEVNY